MAKKIFIILLLVCCFNAQAQVTSPLTQITTDYLKTGMEGKFNWGSLTFQNLNQYNNKVVSSGCGYTGPHVTFPDDVTVCVNNYHCGRLVSTHCHYFNPQAIGGSGSGSSGTGTSPTPAPTPTPSPTPTPTPPSPPSNPNWGTGWFNTPNNPGAISPYAGGSSSPWNNNEPTGGGSNGNGKPIEPNMDIRDEKIVKSIVIDSTMSKTRTDCILNKLKKNSFFRNLLKTFDGINGNKLKFMVGATNNNSDWGVTKGFNNNSYNIIISKDLDTSASDLALMTTLTHELIHARLFYAMEKIGYLKFDTITGEAFLNVDTTGGVLNVKLDTMNIKDAFAALINSYFHNYVNQGYAPEQWTHSLFATAYFDKKSYREKLEELIFSNGDWANQSSLISLSLISLLGSNWESKSAEYLSWKGLEGIPEFQTFLQSNNTTVGNHNSVVHIIQTLFKKDCK